VTEHGEELVARFDRTARRVLAAAAAHGCVHGREHAAHVHRAIEKGHVAERAQGVLHAARSLRLDRAEHQNRKVRPGWLLREHRGQRCE
jgi:hypothetical protein